MEEIALVLLLVTNISGEPDLLIPVPDEKFASVGECKTRRMALEAMHHLDPNMLALCLDAKSVTYVPQN